MQKIDRDVAFPWGGGRERRRHGHEHGVYVASHMYSVRAYALPRARGWGIYLCIRQEKPCVRPTRTTQGHISTQLTPPRLMHGDRHRACCLSPVPAPSGGGGILCARQATACVAPRTQHAARRTQRIIFTQVTPSTPRGGGSSPPARGWAHARAQAAAYYAHRGSLKSRAQTPQVARRATCYRLTG